jgi:plastocyanin
MGLAFIVIAVFGSTANGTPATPTIKVLGGGIFIPNGLVAETFHFLPGDITVVSGSTLTFVKVEGTPDPHTLTIVEKSQLPKNITQVFSCGQSKTDPCSAALHAHFPHNAPPVVEVDTDSVPGLSAPGDSLLLCPHPQKQSCGKGSVSWTVSAPAGSTLYFFCAIHAWMQGAIHVT